MSIHADPVAAMLAEETAADHARARFRGERVAHLADAVINALRASGSQLDPDEARVTIYHTIADALYGDAAIDIPTLRGRS